MTVSNITVKQVFNGDGTTDTFAIPFDYDGTASVVKVYLRDTSVAPATEVLQTITTHYVITGPNVVMVTPPAADEKLIIIRDVATNQEFNPLTTAQLDADALEEELDEIVRMVQETDEKLSRAALLQLGTSASGITIPEPTADGFLKWNAAGTQLENSDAFSDQSLLTTDSPTFAGVTLSGLTASRPVKTGASKELVSGQIDLSSANDVTGSLPVANIAAQTASRALVSDGSGLISPSAVTSTELGYVAGATSSIQDQIDALISSGVWDPDAVETITNKTIDGDDNTLSDIGIASLKTDLAAASTFISRDASGVVISSKAVPAGTVVGHSDTQTLTNKTIDGDDNTIQDLPASTVFKSGTAVPIANGGTGQTTQTAGMDALSPTTTKGDLLVDDGTNVIRLAVGANDEVLVADSSAASGLKWAAASGGGGGGGGGSVVWVSEDGSAPTQEFLFSNKVWSFADGLSQNLYTTIKVPSGYVGGDPIEMKINFFHQASSATQLLLAEATLIKPSEAFDSVTNQRTTTNTAQTAADKIIASGTLDLTSSIGEINAVAVAAGDLIKVRLYRGTDTSTADVSFIESSTEVTFS
jgi:hypothetical protein